MSNYYQTKHRVVEAIQFTGAESVAAIQQFMAPLSPLYGRASTPRVPHSSLSVQVRDRSADTTYPSLSPNYTTKEVGVNGWIVKEEDGELAVMTADEFAERFELVGMGMVDAAVAAAGEALSDPLGQAPPADGEVV